MTMDRPVMSLPIADIAVGDRIGFFNADHAARLGASMAAKGQHDPIHVKRNGNAAKQRWTLIAGLHRLRGSEAVGWTAIDAIQVADARASDADLRRLELSENIDHRHRRPIERAILMVEHARLEEAIDHPGKVGESQHTRGGRMKNSAAVTMTAAEDWRSRTAAAFGVSLSSLERHQRLYRAIVEAMPDLAQRLNDHPLGESFAAMRDIASIKMDDTRRAAVLKVLERDDWPSLSAALEAAGLKDSNGNRVDPANHRAVMITAWAKMPLTDKRTYLEEFPKVITKDMAQRLIVNLMKVHDL